MKSYFRNMQRCCSYKELDVINRYGKLCIFIIFRIKYSLLSIMISKMMTIYKMISILLYYTQV